MAPMMHAMTGVQPWTATEFGLRLAMWAVMMVAMMVPTAAPMTLLYAAVARKAAAQHNPAGADVRLRRRLHRDVGDLQFRGHHRSVGVLTGPRCSPR